MSLYKNNMKIIKLLEVCDVKLEKQLPKIQ